VCRGRGETDAGRADEGVQESDQSLIDLWDIGVGARAGWGEFQMRVLRNAPKWLLKPLQRLVRRRSVGGQGRVPASSPTLPWILCAVRKSPTHLRFWAARPGRLIWDAQKIARLFGYLPYPERSEE
jgi:hypothetical protein